ncbi:hypothetical protein JW859_11545 [bacterium]|nr:hypothetical protein [bacterium]
MKALAFVLTVYCMAAVVAAAAYGWQIGRDIAADTRDRQKTETQLTTLRAELREAEGAYDEINERQVSERVSYTGAEAIQMSYLVQAAKERYVAAQEAVGAANERIELLNIRIDQRRLWFVPLGAATLLHLLGVFFFWPWRERRGAIDRDRH